MGGMGGTTAARLGSSRQESAPRRTVSGDTVGIVIGFVTGHNLWYWVAIESLAQIVNLAQ